MSFSKLPGVLYLHRYITSDCRLRGKEAVINEVIENVRERLEKAYDFKDALRIHTAITIEYPEVIKDG